MILTRAEQIALGVVTMLIAGITVPYLLDAFGLDVMPRLTAVAALAIGGGATLTLRHAVVPGREDVVALTVIVGGALAYLLWMAWPSLLPLGTGPDLTHHLVLIDYIEQHGTLVHETDANGLLGEMADYTPGAHLLAVLAGALTGTSGFAAVYPVVALSVALKAAIFFLTVTRLLTPHPQRTALAAAAIALVLHTSAYSLDSFTRDSFLAQVVSELFALVMWWALVAWWQQPTRTAMSVFAAAGVAVFLTWPMWIGPPVVACAIAVAVRSEMPLSRRASDLALALAPIAAVAAFHVLGRTAAVGIVGTSGAVIQPSPLHLGWWLPALAGAGLLAAATDRRYRMVLVFAAAVALQAAALLVVARRSGAHTPYMAIKMTYLAIYPVIAAVVIGLSLVVRKRILAWAVALLVFATAGQVASSARQSTGVLSYDLWTAGRWARQHLPPPCVDYLVANPDTAYWLHLAVMRNRRASERTVDNDTFETQRAFERWLIGEGPPFAIANLSVVPAEIIQKTSVVHREGSAAVLQRPPASATAAGSTCAVLSSPSVP